MMRWAIEISTAPASEPISTAEAKTHLRETLSDATNDAYIDTLVATARKHVEKVTGQAMITQTIKLYLDRFPASDRPILLPRGPAASITSVQYIDTDGTTQTLSSSNYALDSKSYPARLYLAYNETYPSTRPIENAVTITFTAGYGASGSDVDADLLHAMKLLITHWYDNRESATSVLMNKIPNGVDALLSDYKMYYRGPVE